MQYGAILSQINNHKEALLQANKSVRLIHHLFKDLNDLCIYYSKRLQMEKAEFKELKEKLSQNYIDFDAASLDELKEDTLTIYEKLGIKMLPIIEEVIKRMAKENKPYNYNEEVDVSEKADMRNILGFLNQNEWVYNLNIGNIMQIASVSNTELLHEPRMEYEMTREAFLDKITLLGVSYFCTSTELRFILQLKEDTLIEEYDYK